MNNPEPSYRMAGIGEVLWDILPDGKQLGGSPMNVVYHCQAAGINSVTVSAVGNDDLGREILLAVSAGGNSTEYIQVNNSKPTGTVSVDLNNGIPDFTIHKDVAWDYITWNENLLKLAKKVDAVAFGSFSSCSGLSAEPLPNCS